MQFVTEHEGQKSKEVETTIGAVDVKPLTLRTCLRPDLGLEKEEDLRTYSVRGFYASSSGK